MTTRDDIEIHIIENRSDPDSPLKAGYISGRNKKFAQDYPGRYPEEGGDAYDSKPSTVYIVLTHKGNVVAGGRILIHEKGDQEPLSFERDPSLKMDRLMPHLESTALGYAEIGGIYSQQDFPDDRLMLGVIINETAWDYIKKHPDIDVTIGRLGPKGVLPALHAAMKTQENVIFRTDLNIKVDGVPRQIVLVGKDSVELMSDEQHQAKAGMTPREFWQRYRKLKQESKTERGGL